MPKSRVASTGLRRADINVVDGLNSLPYLLGVRVQAE